MKIDYEQCIDSMINKVNELQEKIERADFLEIHHYVMKRLLLTTIHITIKENNLESISYRVVSCTRKGT